MTRRIPRAALMALVACLLRVVPSHASPLAYVANADDNNVSVIDTDTNTVVKTITGLTTRFTFR